MNQPEPAETNQNRSRSLLRLSKAARAKELNALPVEERLALIHSAQGKDKYSLLLDAADGQQLLQVLPPQDLFLLIKELGREDSRDLVAMASMDQVAVCIDLDSWQGDQLDEDKSLDWLLAALGGTEEEQLQRLYDFDFDLLVLILQRSMTVVKGPDDFSDDDQEPGSGVMPYEFKFQDDDLAKPLGALISALFCRDEFFCRRLLDALRSELPSVLEEEVYQQRRNRLLEYGFPDSFEAMGVYAHLDIDGFNLKDFSRPETLPEPGPVAPGFALAEVPSSSLLAEVLAAGIDSASVWDLSFLLNRVMVADRVDVGDTTVVQETLEQVYGYLNIALEQLCGSSLEKAQEVFEGTYLVGLFRFGHSVVLRLQQEARRLSASSIGSFLDGPYAALVASLQGRKPRYCIAFDGTVRAGDLPFSSLKQVEATRQRLAEVETQRRLFEECFPFNLPGSQEGETESSDLAEVDQLTLSEIFLTALANRILNRDFAPTPIPSEDLSVLHGLVAENGCVSESLRQKTFDWLKSLEPGSENFGHFCFTVWDEEFCGLDSASLDPRYIGGLLLK